MKLVMSAGTLHTLPLAKTFEIARDTGFDGIEIIVNHDFRFADNAGMVRDLQQILPVMALHAPFFQIDGWGDKVRQLYKTVDLAQATGIPLVNFHPPCWLGLELKFWRWVMKISDFQAEIGGGDVVITIENMPRQPALKINPYVFSQTTHLIDFMRAHNLFLTFDTAHMGSTNANFLHDFHLFYNSTKMRNIHFSDYGYGREHLLPGRGILPLTRFLNHLSETGYDETITLELSPYELPEDEAGIRAALAEVYTYLCQETRLPGQCAVG
ncbi:MAG: sugar phosphate isomerase/epimerase [Desulfuromonadaceae bacterium]|nr:sugar phosphate isomerase/epimerase [Desulfuromonadaceae bacterium]